MSVERKTRFAFTINNPMGQDIANLEAPKFVGQVKYMITGYEVGEAGTHHIQGYVIFKNAKTFDQVKKHLPRAHIEAAIGSSHQNIEYCKKDGQYIEIGERPEKKGGRSDLSEIKDAVMQNVPVQEIFENYCNNAQQLRFMESSLKYQRPPKDNVKDVYWLYGPTGTGKTREAIEMAEEIGKEYYMTAKNLQWWDGYNGQEIVIIDEFRADFCTFHELLRILDRYAYRVYFKGGSTWLRAKVIIITSNRSPTEMFQHRVPEDITQLTRRIRMVKEFSAPGGTAPAPPPETDEEICSD